MSDQGKTGFFPETLILLKTFKFRRVLSGIRRPFGIVYCRVRSGDWTGWSVKLCFQANCEKCLPVKVMWGMMSRLIEWHRESIIVWTTLTEKSTYFYSCLKKNSKLTYFTSIWSRILFPKSYARLQKAK